MAINHPIKSLNIKGSLIELDTPIVMGIINATPDSFYEKSRRSNTISAIERACQMSEDGAGIIDIGGCSTRPGIALADRQEELRRLTDIIPTLRKELPDVVISVDTFRADIALKCVEEWGVDIINDISGGIFDPDMVKIVARLKVPYVLGHLRGGIDEFHLLRRYEEPIRDVILDLIFRLDIFRQAGVNDIIIDPGFGFGKDVDENLKILAGLEEFKKIGSPLLVGLSRKSLIWKTLKINTDEALNGTTVLNTIALMKGADILRVHDVKEAVEVVKLVSQIKKNYSYNV